MCWPQPAHVALPHLEQVTFWHMVLAWSGEGLFGVLCVARARFGFAAGGLLARCLLSRVLCDCAALKPRRDKSVRKIADRGFRVGPVAPRSQRLCE